jgi:hypothetical protein
MSAHGVIADIFCTKADISFRQVANCHFMSAIGGRADIVLTGQNVRF